MIKLRNIKKTFQDTEVLKNVNLNIEKGELVVLIGPSGCGKTTTLKMLNKLIKPTSGQIFINGEDISKKDSIKLRRNIGYVIQQTGLFPHMTVGDNISLIPYLEGYEDEKIRKRTIELLHMVGMKPEKYIDRYPNELSGGQQQRIGVARAFATNPQIILMDEPFSALDPITRNQLQDELFNIQESMKKTIVFVTHDMDEALKLADKICIMKGGVVVQYDTPENILKNPSHGFVEEFIGKNRIWNQPEYIKAEDIIIEDPVKAVATRTVLQAAEIMHERHVDSILVVDKTNTLIGIVTLKDIRRNRENYSKVILKDIMKADVVCIHKDKTIVDILEVMNVKNVGYIPVVDDEKKLLGLITRSSLINVLSGQFLDIDGVGM
ncbi:betaine/proline/choline family ABC transporter ATP-binding protein [Clostridium botulinum D/C]|uniref:ABC transporter ATP-binding protein n=1 Tax=Clostridium botulinum TaxID=1491 RepID=UPI001E3C7840|nr:ABC transporter ATP-binding protein [Clostridium botulinum]MCD3352134.1 betaine/proline/choline family ABC transporter ATP-binding protein [Clostridium botulinum D/C]MCD3361081.1 betaine/proline/choline family ABC transporter ATP-binding protein [Clostridium botulinum D/C]MCD3363224.1 betaine/proline/choline family ABC transporter ATP-binding protein [Clostridium botulinum D/C]MCD3366839.1 betaine/proline/choline family ABC transporter ATP-binding protein [Clostridium botulinum D/C]